MTHVREKHPALVAKLANGVGGWDTSIRIINPNSGEAQSYAHTSQTKMIPDEEKERFVGIKSYPVGYGADNLATDDENIGSVLKKVEIEGNHIIYEQNGRKQLAIYDKEKKGYYTTRR